MHLYNRYLVDTFHVPVIAKYFKNKEIMESCYPQGVHNPVKNRYMYDNDNKLSYVIT